jgi:hypothetical protein
VCKRKDSPYEVTEKPSRYWINIKNARYSQLEGREEFVRALMCVASTFLTRWPAVPRRVLKQYFMTGSVRAFCELGLLPMPRGPVGVGPY